MLSSDVKELASLGLPLTTVGTLGLYFVGLYYYEGYFSFWGIDSRSAQIDFIDIMRPSSMTITVLWQAAMAYAMTRQVQHSRLASGKGPDAEALKIHGSEQAYSGSVTVLWLAGMAWLLWSGKPSAWAIVLGSVAGILIGIARSWKWTVHKMGLLALLYFGLCLHARHTGKTDAAGQTDVLTVATKSKQELSLLAIHSSSSGIYGIETTAKTRSVIFIPRQEIVTLTHIRR